MLAAREHARAELRRKLLAKGGEAADVDVLLDRLEHDRLLDDRRFVEEYVDGRRRRGFGPVRVRAELRERGVAEALIAELLDEDGEGWAEALRAAHGRKFGNAPPADMRDLARRARFLEYRG
ncbi:MAG: regulatory protein RecX, partial [Chromatiales bacterium]